MKRKRAKNKLIMEQIPQPFRWMLVIFIALAGTISDAVLLFRHHVAYGLDGYYYLLQVSELHRSGRLFYPSKTPLMFWLLSGTNHIIPDPVNNVKIVAILLQLGLSISVGVLAYVVWRSNWLAVIATLVASWSVLHLFMISEFVKQLGAHFLLVVGLVCFLVLKRWPLARWTSSIGLLLLSVFTHISGALWTLESIAFGGLLLLFKHTDRIAIRILILGVISIAFCSPYLLTEVAEGRLPEQFNDQFTGSGHWPVFGIGFWGNCLLLLTGWIVLGMVLRHYRTIPAESYYMLGVVALFTVTTTFNPFLSHAEGTMSFAGRFCDVAYIQLAILLPGFGAVISAPNRKSFIYAAMVTLVVILTSDYLSGLPHGIQNEYVVEREEMMKHLSLLKNGIAKPAMIVAEHGDEFLAAYTINVPAYDNFFRPGAGTTVYWIIRNWPCRLAEENVILYRLHENDCDVFVPDRNVLVTVKRMTAQEKLHMYSHNRPLYSGFRARYPVHME